MVERKRATILCVDDEALGLYFRKLILEKDGYHVITAGNAQDALKLFSEHPVNLVVTDHLLGRAMGTTMAAEMKTKRPEVPIIILSVRSRERDKIMALDAGADDFVNKPFAVGELLARLRAALRRSTAPPEAAAFSVFRIGDIEVNFGKRRVLVAGTEVVRD